MTLNAVAGSKDTQNILKKIKLLLERSASTTFEGEAENAASLAQKLMLEYGLTEAEAMSTDTSRTEPYIKRKVGLGVPFGALANWRRQLFFALAENSFCAAFMYSSSMRGEPQMMLIVGQETNIKYVEYLYEYLSVQVVNLGARRYTEYKDGGGYTHKLRWLDGYYKGVVYGISSRLRKERLNFIRDSDTATALVPVRQKELADAVKQQVGHTSRAGDTGYNGISYAAYSAGSKDAANVNLNRPVTAGITKAIGG
jgi:hypothetical protein